MATANTTRTTITPGQAHERAAVSHARRHAMQAVRRGMASGEITLTQALTDHRDVLGDKRLLDILGFARGINGKTLTLVGEAAMYAGVNLAQTLNGADARSIRWISSRVQSAPPHASRPAGLVHPDDALPCNVVHLLARHPEARAA